MAKLAIIIIDEFSTFYKNIYVPNSPCSDDQFACRVESWLQQSTVTKAPARTEATEEINSKVDVCELAKHHTNSSVKLYKFIIVTTLNRHIVQHIQ